MSKSIKQLEHAKLVNRCTKIVTAGIASAKSQEGAHRIEDFQIYTRGYAEPGYDGEVIVLGNFNKITRWKDGQSQDIDDTPCRVSDLLEKAGADIQWSDEWTFCGDCGKLVRTSADSYSWKRSYVELDGDIRCCECVEKDPEEYLASQENNGGSCVTLDGIDLGEHGYNQAFAGLQNGLHDGMADDPKFIARNLNDAGITRFLFKLDDPSQFYIEFSLWIHEDEWAEWEKIAPTFRTTPPGPTPAEHCKQALSSVKFAPAQPGQISVTKINIDDGTSTTKQVSHQDFVEGRALA